MSLIFSILGFVLLGVILLIWALWAFSNRLMRREEERDHRRFHKWENE